MVYGTMEEDDDEEEGEEEEESVEEEEEEDYRAFEDSVAPFDPPSLGLVGSPTSPLSTPRVRGACSRVLAAARSTLSPEALSGGDGGGAASAAMRSPYDEYVPY